MKKTIRKKHFQWLTVFTFFVTPYPYGQEGVYNNIFYFLALIFSLLELGFTVWLFRKISNRTVQWVLFIVLCVLTYAVTLFLTALHIRN